jgi:hypothetical protein
MEKEPQLSPVSKTEGGPNIRVVGRVPEEEKEKIRDRVAGFLGENHLGHLSPEKIEELKKVEIEKSPKQIAAIKLANKINQEIMKRAGIDPYEVSERNFHVLPHDYYQENIDSKGSSGTTAQFVQIVGLDEKSVGKSDVYFGSVAYHEMRHLTSQLALEAQEKIGVKDGERAFKDDAWRAGISTYSPYASKEKFHHHLKGLNEAVVSYGERHFIDALLERPEFEAERAHLALPEITELKKKIAAEKGVSEEDVLWVTKPDEKGDYSYYRVSYDQHRNVLDYVMDEILKEMPEDYSSRNEVYKIFEDANFNGRLLPIARMVEKAFGEGSFRVLGMMEADYNSPIQAIELLRKKRAGMLRQKIKKGSKEDHQSIAKNKPQGLV